jgi:glycosyltransferase involved in cell wall biosynthesis
MLNYKRRCLYALNHSFPYSSNGYAVRSHRVAMGLISAGVEVVAVCRPGMPWEKNGDHSQVAALTDGIHTLDGVKYLYTRFPSRLEMSWESYAERSQEIFVEMMRVFKPNMVLAASNWQNAKPAMLAAQQLDLPFFYEVRGFWEVSRLAQFPKTQNSSAFLEAVAQETAVAKGARRVFTLNRFMRDELIRRGVSASRIDLVPNGFDGWAIPDPQLSSNSIQRLKAEWVIGYIGSFTDFEGLENLVKACASLREQGLDVDLLLVGSSEPNGLVEATSPKTCAKTVELKQLAHSLGILNNVHMPGRVSRAQTAAYYSLLDVVVIPRKPLDVCELVSPLKPLEAAAYGKRVLMSDVAPLMELAPLYEGFSYFTKGSLADLIDKLRVLLKSSQGQPLQSDALTQYSWENNVAPMVRAFDGVV